MATSGSTEYYDDCDDYWFNKGNGSYLSLKKRMAPEGVHVMNKNESELLRKLKAETGLTEKELRKIKKYRIMLSNAQDKGEKATKTKEQKAKERIMKDVTKELKLAKEHPLVIKEFNKRWNEHIKHKFYY